MWLKFFTLHFDSSKDLILYVQKERNSHKTYKWCEDQGYDFSSCCPHLVIFLWTDLSLSEFSAI